MFEGILAKALEEQVNAFCIYIFICCYYKVLGATNLWAVVTGVKIWKVEKKRKVNPTSMQ